MNELHCTGIIRLLPQQLLIDLSRSKLAVRSFAFHFISLNAF